MTFQRASVFDSPEFQDTSREPGDDIIIWLLWPVVVVHALVTQPFATRRTYSVSRKLQYQALTTAQFEARPASVLSYLNGVDQAAERLGFHGMTRYAPVSQGDEVRNTNAMSLGLGPTNDDFYLAAASDVAGRFRLTGLTFFTPMTDGFRLVTGNEWRLAPSTRLPHDDIVTFADKLDFADLHALHRRRVTHAMLDGRPPLRVSLRPPGTHPFELFQRWSDETVDYGIRRGYIDPSSPDPVRLTYKGALVVSVKSISQLAPIFDWRARRHANRVMRALGM